MLDRQTDRQTGYPSVDKPWLKYYSKEAINMQIPHKTMYQFAWEKNKENLQEVAYTYYGKKTTYGEFFEKVKRTAQAFLDKGVQQGDIVTIMSMHTPETIISIYALNYIGAVSNLVYMTLSAQEIFETLKNTASKMLLVLETALSRVNTIKDNIDIPVVVLPIADSMPFRLRMLYNLKELRKLKNAWQDGYLSFLEFSEESGRKDNIEYAGNSKDLAVIVYTSGTTGDPKGVMMSNFNLNALVVQDTNGLLIFERGKEVLFILPPFIGFGVSHMHLFLCGGINMHLQINLDAYDIAKQLFRINPYCFVTGPSFIEGILKHRDGNLSNLKYLIFGGGGISTEEEEQLNNKMASSNSSAKVALGYGMTEASSTLCTNFVEIAKKGSVGIPFLLPNVKVVDPETNCEVPYGNEGELLFNTPGLMMGYYKNSEATAETIVEDENGERWLKTGDLGVVDPDGFVYIKGRIKRIFITRGKDNFAYKLFPQRIEELIMSIEGVHSCGVAVKEDPERVNVAIAFISCERGTNAQDVIENANTLVEKELPEHARPVAIKTITKMPFTPSGKIDYRALNSIS